MTKLNYILEDIKNEGVCYIKTSEYAALNKEDKEVIFINGLELVRCKKDKSFMFISLPIKYK